MNRTAKLLALDQLFATLPKLECQRKCSACCKTIGMSGLEFQRLEQAAGHRLTSKSRCCLTLDGKRLGMQRVVYGVCPLLKDGACSAYDARPTICRLWGLTREMRCPFGCEPERFLTEREAFDIVTAAMRLSLA